MDKKQTFILFIITGIFYYLLVSTPQTITLSGTVERVIDGDTIELATGEKIRLIGINTPEKSQPYYTQAKEYTKNLENKTITYISYGPDKYSRTLAHVFHENVHINKYLLLNGFATLYYYKKDQYYSELKNAQLLAQKKEKGIWGKSQNAQCITLIELNEKEKTRCSNQEYLILKNTCTHPLTITFKDEATHIYTQTLSPKEEFTKNFSCIFNDAGDTLFIYDETGMILVYPY